MSHPTPLYRDAKAAQRQVERHGHTATATALAGIAAMIAALEAQAQETRALADLASGFSADAPPWLGRGRVASVTAEAGPA